MTQKGLVETSTYDTSKQKEHRRKRSLTCSLFSRELAKLTFIKEFGKKRANEVLSSVLLFSEKVIENGAA